MREWRFCSSILGIGARWRWMVSFTPQPLYSRGRRPGTLSIGGLVGPTAALDAVEYIKITFSYRKSNNGRQARSPSLNWLSYPGPRHFTHLKHFVSARFAIVFRQFQVTIATNCQVFARCINVSYVAVTNEQAVLYFRSSCLFSG
jgi:hypothetical protein